MKELQTININNQLEHHIEMIVFHAFEIMQDSNLKNAEIIPTKIQENILILAHGHTFMCYDKDIL